MNPTAIHHVGLHVADADRAAAFYVEALGGDWLVRPTPLSGRGADQAIGLDGVRLRIALVSFGVAAVELFEFTGDVVPDWARAPRAGTLPHLALTVSDTDAALERVEAGGGSRVWDAVDRFGQARVIYVRDPDGNVIELLDAPVATIAAGLHRFAPESMP